jgi:hypothetical protein
MKEKILTELLSRRWLGFLVVVGVGYFKAEIINELVMLYGVMTAYSVSKDYICNKGKGEEK